MKSAGLLWLPLLSSKPGRHRLHWLFATVNVITAGLVAGFACEMVMQGRLPMYFWGVSASGDAAPQAAWPRMPLSGPDTSAPAEVHWVSHTLHCVLWFLLMFLYGTQPREVHVQARPHMAPRRERFRVLLAPPHALAVVLPHMPPVPPLL